MIPKQVLWIAGGLVVLLLALNIGQCASKSDYAEERATWEAERSELQRQVSAGRQENEILLAQVQRDSVADAPVIARADSLVIVVQRERAARIAAVNALETQLRVSSDTAELRRIAAQAIIEARLARQEADTLVRTVTDLRSVIDRQTRNLAAVTANLRMTQLRADSAIALLDRAPVYKGDKLFGLIPLPSRTTSLIIGGVLGAATVVVARR